MRTNRIVVLFLLLGFILPRPSVAQQTETNSPLRSFAGALTRLVQVIQPATNEPPRTFTTTLKIVKADGLPEELVGHEFALAYQAPDHLRLSAQWDGQDYVICRDAQEVWVHMPGKKFGLLGLPDVPLFTAVPDLKDTTPLNPIRLPVQPEQLLLLPLLTDVTALPDESVNGTSCRVLKATTKPEAIQGFKLPDATLQLWVRQKDFLPLRIAYRQGKSTDVQAELVNPQSNEAWSAEKWKLKTGPDETVDRVARAHLTRFFSVAIQMMGEKIPTLGPATGERRVAATEGNGRLEIVDGTRVLVLKGTPEEMGRQQGVLLKKEIHELVDRILYGVGVGSSFEKGRWFFGEIELAQNRLRPFMGWFARKCDWPISFPSCFIAAVSPCSERPRSAAIFTMGASWTTCAGWAWSKMRWSWSSSRTRATPG